jgi:hypothetical protein
MLWSPRAMSWAVGPRGQAPEGTAATRQG